MALVTLWFVNAARPRDILLAEPEADRGFARKYLAQLNPAWPRTHIGDFDMIRSTPPSINEFYIGGFPAGVSVVQVVIPGLVRISQVPERFRTLVSAADVYATALVSSGDEEAELELPGVGTVGHEPEAPQLDATYGAFAHWSGGELKRAFSATRQTVFEDEGLPEPVESRYWEGTHETTGILLPFDPSQLAMGAAESWLGFPVTADADAWGRTREVLEIPVAAFAIDGRPEAKVPESTVSSLLPWKRGGSEDAADAADSTSSPDLAGSGYDDYAAPAASAEPTTAEVAKKVGLSVLQQLRRGASAVRKKLR
ncbi:hypothetical protein F7230_09745 [Corynebacterium sp. 320]|uniref:DUF6928 family protein n=1 Tax=Corynebacterium TaxID=1716 RepID=UPI00125CD205|nr:MULTISPECIES: hypothetical protein [Corynebacterium]KAB1501334.1 hypothetical protein F7230_09745 [Corynebacterium sp. 320]KAB1551503.1 hypothetical protein F7233_08415 [Corynebacterium sp. 321]KAB1551669.1 hypothetical protein F7232_05860 [Corynebacterium sp. 319]KAB3525699.1 hypothetical protein F8354_09745 [Corynebacterium sp. 250]KAB3538659.1 hypothetical protein F8390_06415 [Corynebacterium sp. 366]